MSLPIGRQRRYDLFLATVPLILSGALVAWWAFDVSLHLAAAGSALVAGVVLLAGTISHPPNDPGDG